MTRSEAQREIDKLTDEQIDTIEREGPVSFWSCARRARWIWMEAVRRGWLLGPA